MDPTLCIGIFDSGVGGLTVLRAIRQALPSESLVYLGDTARVPYGNKSRETVTRYSFENARFLLARGVKTLVVACNTSTACALDALTAAVPVPVIGVIMPGARQAIAATRSQRIGVIATAGTVASEAYALVIKTLAPAVHVVSRSCPLFVALVEEGWTDTPATRLIAESYLAPMRAERIDTLILGCTHYPLLAETIRAVMGSPVTLVDSGTAVARDLEAILRSGNGLAPRGGVGSIHLYVTDGAPQFAAMASLILDGERPQLTHVVL